MTWISTERAMELLGIKRRQFFRVLKRGKGEIETRTVPARGRGRPRFEIKVESLTREAQNCFHESQTGIAGAVASPGSKTDGVSPPHPAAPALHFTETQLAKVNDIADALRAVRAASDENRRAEKEKASAKLDLSVRRIEQLGKRFDDEGIRGLVRKKRKDGPRALDRRWVDIASAIFLKKRTPSFKKAHRELEKECTLAGIEPPSYSWTVRWIKKTLPKPTIAFKRSLKKYREDWRVKYEPCVLREKHDVIRDICDGDWQRLDLFVVDDEGVNGGEPYRPFLCPIGDCCSDEIFGIHVQPIGSALGIGLALRHALLPKRDPATNQIDDKVPQACAGRFNEFFTDNGRDFVSAHISAVMHDLHGSTRTAEGYHGQSKPIERWFGTLAGDLISELPGFCGRSPQHRPHDYKPTLTRRELFAEIYKWTFYDYHRRPTPALRNLSPYDVLTKHVEQGFRPVVPDERVLDFLLMPGRTVTVHKWGIEMFGTSDRRNIYNDDLLGAKQIIGEKVLAKYHPDDLGTLYIYKDNQFLGMVHQERRRGYREKDLSVLYRRRKVARQAVETTIKETMARAQYPDDAERAKAERVYAEMEAEELRSIASGSSPGTVPDLLPQYRKAQKAYTLKKHLKALPSANAKKSAPAPEDDPLPPTDREVSTPACCHECNKEEGEGLGHRLRHCLDCLYRDGEAGCDQCRGAGAHRYCPNCMDDHEHNNPGTCEGCGKRGPTLKNCFNHPTKSKAACTTCNGTGSHRYCPECLAGDDHKGHSFTTQAPARPLSGEIDWLAEEEKPAEHRRERNQW